MMVRFNETYLNAAEIASISKEASSRNDHPFRVIVRLKNESVFSVVYGTEASANETIYRLTEMCNRACPTPVSRYELQSLLDGQTSKLLRYIREIKKIVTEGFSHE